MDETSRAQVDLIREAFYYQSRFDGSTMVFKIDFPITEDPRFPYLMKDLALLAETGIRIVIVPGAKEWIDSVLREYDIVSEYSGTVRITTEDAIPFVKMAAFDAATRFMTELSACRVDAVVGNFVRARGLGVIDGVDFGNSGKVDRILTESIRRILDLGMVPILPCIGWSAAGKPYNLPSDEIALASCAALGAVKFFIVSADPGIRGDRQKLPDALRPADSGRVARLTPAEADEVLALNRRTGEADGAGPRSEDRALAELDLALRACRSGVERVHLVDGREEGAVLRELFSNLGVGTMVYADEYESIRPMEAHDITEVLRLMEPLMASGILVRRTAEELGEKKDDYVVYDVDGSVHACGALHDWGDAQGEIAGLATDPAYGDLGLGRRIVRYLIERASRRSLRRVFALTTKTHDWFELLGFREAGVDTLPERKRRAYDEKRRSKVFALDLGSAGSQRSF
jgi:amino-acid N-acetyltransferase